MRPFSDAQKDDLNDVSFCDIVQVSDIFDEFFRISKSRETACRDDLA
jgi:hypothetical protein